MKIEVPISKRSEEYMRETFARYTETTQEPRGTIKRCIIHIYPLQDTMNEEGELDGYIDAMNFEVNIYNVDNMTVYKRVWHDQVQTDMPCRVRIFKDLSTMMIFDKPINLLLCKSIWVTEGQR